MKKKVIFRADGNSKIGLGHVYRLLALVEMLKDQFECVFAIDQPDAFTQEQIKKNGADIITLSTGRDYELPDNNATNEELPFDLASYIDNNTIVVTDGYLFGTKYQQAVKATGTKLVCIDDLAQVDFYADAIINHAPGVDHNVYQKQAYTKVYTGLDYAMLRTPFFSELPAKPPANDVFISLGGSDYFQYTKKLITLLLPLQRFDTFHVLCSSAFDKEQLSYLQTLSNNNSNIQLHYNVDAPTLTAIVDKCKYAFVAASTVLFESYARGAKCFAGFYTRNQQFIYNGFIKEKRAIALNDFASLNSNLVSEAFSHEQDIQTLAHRLQSKENIQQVFVSL